MNCFSILFPQLGFIPRTVAGQFVVGVGVYQNRGTSQSSNRGLGVLFGLGQNLGDQETRMKVHKDTMVGVFLLIVAGILFFVVGLPKDKKGCHIDARQCRREDGQFGLMIRLLEPRSTDTVRTCTMVRRCIAPAGLLSLAPAISRSMGRPTQGPGQASRPARWPTLRTS